MSNPTNQLFVYGSLLSGFHHPAYQYMAKYFQLLGTAAVKGVLYDKGDYPVALPSSHEKFIAGELYVLKNENEFSYAIEQLDDYEGLNVEVGETPLFKREQATIYCNGQTTHAWIYWFNGNVNGLPEVPSGDVLAYIETKNK